MPPKHPRDHGRQPARAAMTPGYETLTDCTNRDRDSADCPGRDASSCIGCRASVSVGPELIVWSGERVRFARQPSSAAEEDDAWRVTLVCPTGSVKRYGGGSPPMPYFPEEIAQGVFRCGFNACASYGAHSYFSSDAACALHAGPSLRSPGYKIVEARAFADGIMVALNRIATSRFNIASGFGG
jgi:hypothetical protein